jgi:hypothetical protein
MVTIIEQIIGKMATICLEYFYTNESSILDAIAENLDAIS